jgi:hypothetical protein
MTRKIKANADEKKTEPAKETACSHCEGAGVLFTSDAHHTGVSCCDQCETGRLIWSRVLELLADMDIPGPVQTRPEVTDSISRDQAPRMRPGPTSGPELGVGDE